MRLTSLYLSQCPAVKDLTPLKDMPLTELHVSGAHAAELDLFQGMPLHSLYLSKCDKVVDWTPLAKMNLRLLSIDSCKDFSDLTPLKDMELADLHVADSPVKDLTPLTGMPLTTLSLPGCLEIHDLTPLAGMKLSAIGVPPRVTKGMEVLRQMNTLTNINGMPAERFWKEYDAAKAKSK